MDRLDEYADINPKRFKQYACHATVIRKWIREDKVKNPQGCSKEWVEKLKDRVKNCHEISVSAEQIAFHPGNAYIVIKYTEHAYKQQIISRLRKMEISVEGLE